MLTCRPGGLLRSALRPHRRSPSNDHGAAAVEFALLLPIFVIMVFGTLSVGLAYWKHISDVQAARDAARYGSTLPFAAAGTDTVCGEAGVVVTTWLNCVRDVAISQSALWQTTADVTATDAGYVCVAYVKSDITGSSGTVATNRVTVGTRKGDDPALPTASGTGSTGGCYLDNRHDNRVQIVIGRDARFNAVFLGRNWRMNTQAAIPYERGAP